MLKPSDEAALQVARRLMTNGDHAHLQTLLSQFDATVLRRRILAASYSPNHPELRRLSGGISILLSQIAQETKSLSSTQNASPLADSRKEIADQSTAPIDVSGPRNLPATETGLHTRLFRLDSQMMLRLLGQEPDSSVPAGGDVVQLQLHQFLMRNGIPFPKPANGQDLSPNQPAVFFNRTNGVLFARATLTNLDRLEKVIQNLSPVLHQITVEARFVEGDINAIAALNISGLTTNALAPGHALLTETEAEALLARFKASPGFEILTTPKVTTLSGRAAEISVVDYRTVVTGQSNTPAGIVVLLTNSVPCGPTLQVTAWHDTAQPGALKMSVTARFVEFLGYQEAPTPTPLIRSNSVSAEAHLWDGQTHLLQMAPITNQVQFVDRVPIFSDLPMVGRLFRSSGSQLQVRQRLVLITPTLIDPTGRRLYDASRRPFDPATKP